MQSMRFNFLYSQKISASLLYFLTIELGTTMKGSKCVKIKIKSKQAKHIGMLFEKRIKAFHFHLFNLALTYTTSFLAFPFNHGPIAFATRGASRIMAGHINNEARHFMRLRPLQGIFGANGLFKDTFHFEGRGCQMRAWLHKFW